MECSENGSLIESYFFLFIGEGVRRYPLREFALSSAF